MFKPVGDKILVLPSESKNTTTESNIELVNNTLAEGVVVAASDFLKDIYKVGDIVYYPPNAGIEYPYQGKVHKILVGREHPSGDVWGKEA